MDCFGCSPWVGKGGSRERERSVEKRVEGVSMEGFSGPIHPIT